MRLTIAHDTVYRFARPETGLIQMLRLTPRNFSGQHVVRWRIDVDQDCRLEPHEDAFGNLTHTFTVSGPIEALTLRVDGVVETSDTAGVIRDAVERFPPGLYLRETMPTRASGGVVAFAESVRREAEPTSLALMHQLMAAVHRTIAGDDALSALGAGEALELGRGAAADRAHLFIAAARHLGTPSRFVAGYAFDDAKRLGKGRTHAWAEAHVPGLGWVGFDPTLGHCPQGAHVRLAIGLDGLGAAPVRGTNPQGEGHDPEVRVVIDQALKQVQA